MKQFIPGKDLIQYAQAVFDQTEIDDVVDVLKKGWLGLGVTGLRLEKQLATLFQQPKGLVVNSGSSANLLAILALKEKNQWLAGSEVITTAGGFPTTFNPILQAGLVPVVVDIELGTYNINTTLLKKALSSKTVAVSVAHTLGNPVDLKVITEFCRVNDLALLLDCCDALGSTYEGKSVGSFGDTCTLSMYPAHHITAMGEGGFIGFKDPEVHKIALSLRDWGRSCYCNGQASLSQKGSCGRRFSDWLGDGSIIDHKYIYDYVGYNLKPTEAQCAFAIRQLERLPFFIEKRKEHFEKLLAIFKPYNLKFILPSWNEHSDVSWFAFPVTISTNASFTREQLCTYLEEKKIQTRPLFAGNILKHPAYRTSNYRVASSLAYTDYMMKNTFFIGVHPSMTEPMFDWIKKSLEEFLC